MKQHAPSAAQDSIRIRVLGMDERATRTLAMAFRGPGKQKYLITEDATDAQALLLDMDAVGADTLWQQYCTEGRQLPVIIISVRDKQLPDVRWLKKPVKMGVLFKLLDEIQTRISQQPAASASSEPVPATSSVVSFPDIGKKQSAVSAQHETVDIDMDEDISRIFCGKADDIDLADIEQHKRIYYAPDLYFQGVLKKAIDVASSTQKAIRIEGIQKPLTVLPDRRGLITDIDDRMLRALCHGPAIQSALSFEPVIMDLDSIADTEKLQRIDSFMWKTALLSAQGRIPNNIDTWQAVKMRAWPNFTRLTITPHAMRIASLWSQEPRSLAATARSLGIPQRYVFAFFSACYALSYVDVVNSKPDKHPSADTAHSKIRSHKRRGLFERILQHLGAAR